MSRKSDTRNCQFCHTQKTFIGHFFFHFFFKFLFVCVCVLIGFPEDEKDRYKSAIHDNVCEIFQTLITQAANYQIEFMAENQKNIQMILEAPGGSNLLELGPGFPQCFFDLWKDVLSLSLCLSVFFFCVFAFCRSVVVSFCLEKM